MGVVKGWGRALPIFGATKGSAFSTNAQSKSASLVLDSVLGPLGIAHLTVSLYLCSSRSNAIGESRPFEGSRVS